MFMLHDVSDSSSNCCCVWFSSFFLERERERERVGEGDRKRERERKESGREIVSRKVIVREISCVIKLFGLVNLYPSCVVSVRGQRRGGRQTQPSNRAVGFVSSAAQTASKKVHSQR